MTDEQRDPEAVVRRVFELLEAGRAAEAVELLHPDLEWRNTGLPTVRGRRVHEMLLQMERRGVRFSARMHHVAASGDVVLTDRTDVLTYGRWSASFWVRGTYRVRDGRIVLWDDAFSWGDVMRGSVVGLVRAVTSR